LGRQQWREALSLLTSIDMANLYALSKPLVPRGLQTSNILQHLLLITEWSMLSV
jgi:hypothetical protein